MEWIKSWFWTNNNNHDSIVTSSKTPQELEAEKIKAALKPIPKLVQKKTKDELEFQIAKTKLKPTIVPTIKKIRNDHDAFRFAIEQNSQKVLKHAKS